jgi:oxygen-independent coproporphyrinogen-3 oxidase
LTSVDLDIAARKFSADGIAFAKEMAALAPLVSEGLARFDGHRITVNDSARAFVRVVASIFDRYLQSGRARHSCAI